MTANQRARADEQVPDDVDGMPTAATVTALLIGLAVGLGIAMFMTAMHWAGQGRIPW